MKKRTLIVLVGLFIALVPFLGLPQSWKSNIVTVTGLVVAGLAFTRRKILRPSTYAVDQAFVEHPLAASVAQPHTEEGGADSQQKKARRARSKPVEGAVATDPAFLPEAVKETVLH